MIETRPGRGLALICLPAIAMTIVLVLALVLGQQTGDHDPKTIGTWADWATAYGTVFTLSGIVWTSREPDRRAQAVTKAQALLQDAQPDREEGIDIKPALVQVQGALDSIGKLSRFGPLRINRKTVKQLKRQVKSAIDGLDSNTVTSAGLATEALATAENAIEDVAEIAQTDSAKL